MSDLTQQKQSVVDACVRLADQGYLAGTGGNVALRIDERHFLVTPSGADYYSMLAEDICLMRLDTLAQLEGAKPASVERGLHAVLLKAKPEAWATIHTHQPIASAVALLHVDIPVPADWQAQLGDRIAVVPYGPSGTSLLVRALTRRLRPGINGYLLGSHGVVCAGPTLEQAIARVRLIEASAAGFLAERIGAEAGLDNRIKIMALDAVTHFSAQDMPS